jgi:hypothetical protein
VGFEKEKAAKQAWRLGDRESDEVDLKKINESPCKFMETS